MPHKVVFVIADLPGIFPGQESVFSRFKQLQLSHICMDVLPARKSKKINCHPLYPYFSPAWAEVELSTIAELHPL